MLKAFLFNPITVAGDVGFRLGIIPTNRLQLLRASAKHEK